MRVLALDVGSSSVKAAVLRDGSLAAGPVRAVYPTRFEGVRAEIDPPTLLKAVATAVAELDTTGVDLVGLAVLGPAFVAMDADGEPLTPLVTYADRRSLAQAGELERRIGLERHREITGNAPVPGATASTTWAWYLRHEPERMARADLVGLLNTYLHRQLTGVRVIDPSNASFLGVYETATLAGWSQELIDAVGGRRDQLPEVLDGDRVAGRLGRRGADLLGVRGGTPVLTGCLDGTAALLAAGAAQVVLRPGQLVNAIGSTDVLAMCADVARPRDGLLTRALGVGRRWVSVNTIAAAGSALDWAHRTLFAELSVAAFRERLTAGGDPGGVMFRPYLAGDRTTIRPPAAGFTGLTLATTREHMLAAVVEALVAASAARLSMLDSIMPPLPTVYTTGGGAGGLLGELLHRDWPPPRDGGSWQFVPLREATLTGVGVLAVTSGGGP